MGIPFFRSDFPSLECIMYVHPRESLGTTRLEKEKVYHEIQRVVTSDSPTYEELMELKYLEQVLSETLRLYPPIPLVNRMARETKHYGNIVIPKGAGILIPLDLVMKDPRNFRTSGNIGAQSYGVTLGD
uniref:Cytochrome P450 n=1 Tax=Biomphalaria glabrata TaxID=6526 RepID=A0A2C9KB83_BIOGL